MHVTGTGGRGGRRRCLGERRRGREGQEDRDLRGDHRGPLLVHTLPYSRYAAGREPHVTLSSVPDKPRPIKGLRGGRSTTQIAGPATHGPPISPPTTQCGCHQPRRYLHLPGLSPPPGQARQDHPGSLWPPCPPSWVVNHSPPSRPPNQSLVIAITKRDSPPGHCLAMRTIKLSCDPPG